MYLDVVSEYFDKTNENGLAINVESINKKEVYSKWENWFPSQISHHRKMCCKIAHEWIIATDFSELNGDCIFTGPRWLRQKYNWGASRFPIFWCEAVRKDTLDCGALAALAQEVFVARGVKTYRVQIVQKFSETSTHQWSESWNDTNEPLKWIENDRIYHEACAIELGARRIKIWDASAGWWIDPKQSEGYGSVLAIRVSAFNLPSGTNLIWGDYPIKTARWIVMNSLGSKT